MGPDAERDDLLSDLPPLPPVGQAEETGLDGLRGLDDGVDFVEPEGDGDGDDEAGDRVAAGTAESGIELEAEELIDAGEEEGSWVEGSEAAGDAVDPGAMVDVGDAEYGLTGDLETADIDDPAVGIDDLGDAESLLADAGDEGLEEAGSSLWRRGPGGGTDDDVPPGLPPLERDEPGDTDAEVDLGADLEIDVPSERDPGASGRP